MNVWVVVEEIAHEGGTTLGVFSTEDKAAQFVAVLDKKNEAFWRWFEVLEFETDVPKSRWWFNEGG